MGGDERFKARGFTFLIIGRRRASRRSANVTVLLEEPYSYDGALAGTGHTAVYLTRVCAATPIILRRCNPGEHGAVISRYARIAGYDWIAIPLVPYLYAVEKPEDIPLYADPKLVAFLRDQYRRAHLEDFAPDAPGGETPKGDWYELIGSSYDRTNYGFEIETTPEQDDAFIAWLNSRPNRASYHFVSRNCADFVRDSPRFLLSKIGIARQLGRPLRQHAETCGEIAREIQQTPSGFGIHAFCYSTGARQREAQQAGSRRSRVALPGKKICCGSRCVSSIHCRGSRYRLTWWVTGSTPREIRLCLA